ncbi:FAD-binding domain-containing protein [Violaceomyces palustris]|uniref:FAD-binding domain-containing protein n=1 Tax=Violaceomyces palustris TaxID=1673888 RepID=A0ACD0NWQ6_9BASI|nr:FAD-binding domain-containing protein [Violaceomyces palustris]
MTTTRKRTAEGSRWNQKTSSGSRPSSSIPTSLLLLFPPTLLLLLLLHLSVQPSNTLPTHPTSEGPLDPRSSSSSSSQDSGLEDCLISNGISLITSSLNDSSTYFKASSSDNLLFHYNPRVIVYPKDEKEVQSSVLCASSSSQGQLAVVARSGGHSFGGYGSGGQDGSMIIDLSELNSIVSSPQTSKAEIGPGARLGDVVKELWNQGQAKRAIPHGTCPPVGVGGHSLCGGFGPTSRKWGMMTDSILEAKVVLANSSLVTASERENQELLWGIKGGGSYLGIVTGLTFRTYDASERTTFFEYYWDLSIRDPRTLSRIQEAVQDFAKWKDLPDSIGFHLQFQREVPKAGVDGADRIPVTLKMRGSYLGKMEDFQPLKRRFQLDLENSQAPPPDRKVEKEVDYLTMMEEWDDFGRKGDKLDTQAERQLHNNFVAKTSLTLGQVGFSRGSLDPVFEKLWNASSWMERGRSNWEWNVYMELYGGERVEFRDEHKVKSSSLSHRDGLWLIQTTVGTWSWNRIDRRGREFATEVDQEFQRSIRSQPGMGRASYSCYLDPTLKEDEWKGLYYGDSLPRLQDLKSKLDPDNLFRNPQSLGRTLRTSQLHTTKVEGGVHPLP